MRFAPWASAGSAARSVLGTPMRIGVLRAPLGNHGGIGHSVPVFVDVFSCGEVVCSATLPEDLCAIDRRGPERPVQQQTAFLAPSPADFPYQCSAALTFALRRILRSLP